LSHKIKVNLVAGSGAYQGPGSWIFSDMVNILLMGVDSTHFEITVTERIDESKLYDVYHYLHSSLAVRDNNKMAHRALVTVQAMGDFNPSWSFESKAQAFHRAKIISSVSTSIIGRMVEREVPSDKIRYTPAGVDFDKFKPTDYLDKQVLAEQYNVANDVIRFGIISRFYEDGRKGEEFLTDIILNFTDHNRFRFMFVGANWVDYLAKITTEHNLDPSLFELFDRNKNCTYEDYPNLYGLMDGILVTSKIDSGPICILEALAKGLPVVSTPTGLANELLVKRIDGHKIGQVVQYGDTFGFVDAINDCIITRLDNISNVEVKNTIRNVLQTPYLYAPVNQYSANLVHQAYSWDNFCHRFEDIYQEIYDSCSQTQFIEDFVTDDSQNNFVKMYSDSAVSSLTKVYTENYQQIKSYVAPGIGIAGFRGSLKGRPAVIIGVGASLDKHIETLQVYQNKIVIVACDAALPVLRKNDITPHLVVVADPYDRQVKNFTGSQNGRDFITTMPSVVHPMTFNEARKHDCVITWYNIADSKIELCKWIPKEVGYKGLVRPAVLTTGMAYQIALWLGCGPTTFIGHDLCWQWPPFEHGYATGIDKTKADYQKKNKMLNKPVFLWNDLNGNPVVTELSFINFVQWINHYLQELDLTTYNSTGNGILYGGRITQMDFDEWCQKYSMNMVPFSKDILFQVYNNLKFGNDIPVLPV
jgi:glycosyltransferase involved in cell wall biosynthesis